jgi:hypothetical protein
MIFCLYNTMDAQKAAQSRYYQNHREEILQKYKNKKPWLAYYERHKEEVKRKALERYYAKKSQLENGIPADYNFFLIVETIQWRTESRNRGFCAT